MAEHAATNPLDPKELFKHVEDADEFHFPRFVFPDSHGHYKIPQPFLQDPPIFVVHTGKPIIDNTIQPLDLRITKFMVIELAAALILCALFIGLGQALKGGVIPRGKLRNMLEAMLLYFRDNVARPCIGHHDADRFVPFLWTLFFFVLSLNLFGIIPWMGSPTGSLAVTGALAFTTFLVVVGAATLKLGPAGFIKSFVPHMDLPLAIKIPMILLMFPIEVLGLLIKHFVLSVRLLANMMGGHVVLAVILAFIGASATSMLLWVPVTFLSVSGAVALSMLELFVAFLQAYIFTFLAALFIGMALHPH
jgi:F-type H+-transporting ATPase subunit a